MADEWDRKMMPELMQTGFRIWLGAAYDGFEIMKRPKQCLGKIGSQMGELFSVPSDAGEGIQNKAKAVAAVWMEKSATLMEHWKACGGKFTDAD